MNKMAELKLHKKNKPTFVRYNSQYLKKLGSNWRTPRGIHNKVREKRKGHPKMPSIGYGSSKQTLGLYKSEFDYKLVNSEKDLKNLDKKYIIISSKLGLKKRLQIINEIKALNIKVLNIKDLDKYVKGVEERLKQNKEIKKTEKQKKQETKKKIEEKVIQKEKTELTQEEKSEKEKLEKKKTLEKGQ